MRVQDSEKMVKRHRGFIERLRLKVYHFVISFPYYLLTPVEKVFFNVIIALFTTLIVTAAYLYLPNFINSSIERGYYYWYGIDHKNLLDPQAFAI